MINWIIVLAFKDFLADLEKQHGRHSSFSYLYSSFSSYSYCGCVIATVFKLSREIRYSKRLLENMVFGACLCVHWLGGVNLLLALCSNYYSVKIYQIFSIASLVLGVVIAQFWLLCSHWLCLCWSHCRDPHTHFFAKCVYPAQYWS